MEISGRRPAGIFFYFVEKKETGIELIRMRTHEVAQDVRWMALRFESESGADAAPPARIRALLLT